MSRWTLQEQDLIITIGMDYAVQFWLTDHRGESIPVERPARMTVKDSLGQVLFDAETIDSDGTSLPPGLDPLTEAYLVTSPVNGMVQLTLPRGLTQLWAPGTRFSYDLWATVYDGGAGGAFPTGQQLPVARGRFILQSRVTQMEAP